MKNDRLKTIISLLREELLDIKNQSESLIVMDEETSVERVRLLCRQLTCEDSLKIIESVYGI